MRFCAELRQVAKYRPSFRTGWKRPCSLGTVFEEEVVKNGGEDDGGDKKE